MKVLDGATGREKHDMGLVQHWDDAAFIVDFNVETGEGFETARHLFATSTDALDFIDGLGPEACNITVWRKRKLDQANKFDKGIMQKYRLMSKWEKFSPEKLKFLCCPE